MYFCTLFDSNYVSKGIALYLSIESHTDDFTLYVMGMDRKCQEILTALGFKHMQVECIDDVQDVALVEARGNRSRAEFCWTCGSFFTDYFLHKYNLPDITYLDSDLMFYNSPKVVFDELYGNKASVGLTPHFTQSTLFGRYCVQYVYFKNDEEGTKALTWWKNECLKWCYSKLEDGKYGDQKYLDRFAERFDNVYDIDNRGVGIAYWNMYHYRYRNGMVSYKGQEWPVVFFHYSGINISVKDGVMTFRHTMYLTDVIRKTFIEPYAQLMQRVFCDYLDNPVNRIEIVPMNRINYTIKGLGLYLNKVLPVEWMIAQIMKLKYRERLNPYSER